MWAGVGVGKGLGLDRDRNRAQTKGVLHPSTEACSPVPPNMSDLQARKDAGSPTRKPQG